MRRLLVMVTAPCPGLGKTTLTHRLADELRAAGTVVEVFEEPDIYDAPAYAAVMASFLTVGRASTGQLLDASKTYLEIARAGPWHVLVQDMLMPYLPSLLAWGLGDDEIARFFDDLEGLTGGVDVLQIHLDGDPAPALGRAANREGPEWQHWFVPKVAGYDDLRAPVLTLDDAVQHFRVVRRRTRRLLATAPWPVVTVDGDQGPDRVAAEAFQIIEAHRRSHG